MLCLKVFEFFFILDMFLKFNRIILLVDGVFLCIKKLWNVVFKYVGDMVGSCLKIYIDGNW